MADKLNLADRLRSGETLLTAWCAIPEPLVAEYCARGGFDVVTLDMQHGFQDYQSVMRSVAGVNLADVPLVARVPVGDFAMASRLIDVGVEAIIAPMINSVEEAEEFAEAMKYPPLGGRSWGPARTISLRGHSDLQSYLEVANDRTLAIAMIETPQAIEAAQDIMGTPGIDGVFVGPSDLSLTLSDGASIDPLGELAGNAARDIAALAREQGVIAAALAPNAQRAREFTEMGFQLVAIGSDAIYLQMAARQLVDSAR